jgi:hypothetical protein
MTSGCYNYGPSLLKSIKINFKKLCIVCNIMCDKSHNCPIYLNTGKSFLATKPFQYLHELSLYSIKQHFTNIITI